MYLHNRIRAAKTHGLRIGICQRLHSPRQRTRHGSLPRQTSAASTMATHELEPPTIPGRFKRDSRNASYHQCVSPPKGCRRRCCRRRGWLPL